MIQRIQSIFLLISAIALALLFKFPFAVSDQATASFLADRRFDILDHPALMILAGLGALLALVALFLFKNRPVQLKLSTFVIVLSVLLIVFSIILFLNESKAVAKSVNIEDGLGVYLPLAALVFAVLASRFIKKDEKTVQSMDRLR